MKFTTRAAVLIGLLFGSFGPTASLSNAASLPAGGVPLSAAELYDMYRGKTQAWPEGAGGWYFGTDRRLSAYASKPPGSYAVGKWYITESGKVCVVARWIWAKGSQGKGPNQKTCWAHQKVGSQIWKLNPKTKAWYQWNASGGESATFVAGYKFSEQVTALYALYGS